MAYIRLVMKGWTAEEIACKLAKPGTRHYRRIRRQVLWAIGTSSELQALAAAETRGNIIGNAGDISDALVRRAKRGRTDSIKLGLAIAEIHSDRVSHEHSGELEIKITGMSRPPRVGESGSDPEPVVDADVVEE